MAKQVEEECVEFTCPNLLTPHNYGDPMCGYYLIHHNEDQGYDAAWSELVVKENYPAIMRLAWYGKPNQ